MSDPRRGEVWFADLEPVRGHEQGRQRPVLVVSTNPFNASAADLVIAVAITSVDKRIRSHVRVEAPEGGLDRPSWVMCEQIRTVAKERLERRLGELAPKTLQAVQQWLRVLLEL